MKNVTFLLLIGLLPNVGWGQGYADLSAMRDSEYLIKVSGDLAKQVLSGPSYEDFIKYGNVLEFNVSFYFIPGWTVGYLQKGYKVNSNLRIHPTTLLVTNDNRPGPTVPAPEPSVKGKFYPLVGIQLIGKGGSYTDRFGTSTTRSTYIEIPVYAVYRYTLPDNKGRVFGGAGVYIGYGLWGTTKNTDPVHPANNESFPAFDKNLGYKRFDAGLAFMAGYQLPQGLWLSLEYELGLINIDPGGGDDKTRNRLLSLNVGYPLKKLTTKLQKK